MLGFLGEKEYFSKNMEQTIPREALLADFDLLQTEYIRLLSDKDCF